MDIGVFYMVSYSVCSGLPWQGKERYADYCQSIQFPVALYQQLLYCRQPHSAPQYIYMYIYMSTAFGLICITSTNAAMCFVSSILITKLQ